MTPSPAHHLAHFNLAMSRYALDHPAMAGFTSQLERVNRRASESEGFVWTPTDEEAGDVAAVFGSPLALANVSTWRSLEDLRRFVYDGLHGAALGRRREWFDRTGRPPYVLWWVNAAHRPGWTEASERLDHLERHGPTPHAFTFTHPFDQPASE